MVSRLRHVISPYSRRFRFFLKQTFISHILGIISIIVSEIYYKNEKYQIVNYKEEIYSKKKGFQNQSNSFIWKTKDAFDLLSEYDIKEAERERLIKKLIWIFWTYIFFAVGDMDAGTYQETGEKALCGLRIKQVEILAWKYTR